MRQKYIPDRLVFTIYNYIRDSVCASLQSFPELKSIIITEEPSSGPDVGAPWRCPVELYKGVSTPYGVEAMLDIIVELRLPASLAIYLSLHDSNLLHVIDPMMARRPVYDVQLRQSVQAGPHRERIFQLLQDHLHSLDLYPSLNLLRVSDTLNFLSHTRLEILRIYHFNIQAVSQNLYRVPATPEDRTSICSSLIHLRHLTTLTMHHCTVQADLATFLSRHIPTLTHVTLTNNYCWSDAGIIPWHPILSSLAQSDVLEYLQLSQCAAAVDQGWINARSEGECWGVGYAVWEGNHMIKTRLRAIIDGWRMPLPNRRLEVPNFYVDLLNPGSYRGERWFVRLALSRVRVIR
ncbi:hypothetical protein K491DRAFT_20163 [Lophiostoma macrostomum CBS 122681]|uniref:Uncharacterized protein n=1 Tax=Lophiostoma macrostomum CBS 122681 TaxID=1314788 RepID=A0A6A6TNY2_9PLEO|nr:hypothetical protein K491DRAFT_20163 [Lophiostoma macrostomum CBS 122681]